MIEQLIIILFHVTEKFREGLFSYRRGWGVGMFLRRYKLFLNRRGNQFFNDRMFL